MKRIRFSGHCFRVRAGKTANWVTGDFKNYLYFKTLRIPDFQSPFLGFSKVSQRILLGYFRDL